MLSKAVVHRGMRWLSPVGMHHISQSRPFTCASLASSSSTAELAGMKKNGIQTVTLCVEGNISSGKSTFLQELMKGSLELKDKVEVLPCQQWLCLM